MDSGLTTVYAISGPYVGTSSSGSWANKVYNLMAEYRGMAPPTPTPTPTPSPTPTPHHQITIVQIAKPTPVAKPATHESSASASTVNGEQDLFAAGGLFVALLLFGWGCLMRLRPGVRVEPVTGALALSLPPLYANERSPIAERQESGESALEPQLALDLAELSLLPTQKVMAQQPEPVTGALGDGLLTRRAEMGFRRVRLREVQARTEELANEMGSRRQSNCATARTG